MSAISKNETKGSGSVLVCGHKIPNTTSPLRWEMSSTPNLKKAVLKQPDGRATVFYRVCEAGGEYNPHASLPSHDALNLRSGESGFLLIHDGSRLNINDSMQCMRTHVNLLLEYGGRGFWVVIDTSKSPRKSEVDRLTAQFKAELNKCPESFVREVLAMPVADAYQLAAERMPELPFFPREVWHRRAVPELQANQDFFASFLRGDVTPWKHKDYLLAAYLTLLDPENRNLGLLEVASNFADNVNRLKQKHSRIQLMPESRTLTVFWLYHVKLGIHAMSMFWNCDAYLGQFKRIFHFTPELMNEKLPESYYSPDILRSEYAEKFWMLPNLRELLEPHRYLNADFRREFVKKSEGDPDQLLRFAFEVVQRYLRPGETRRRSWFINLAFAVLQKQIIRLRSMKLSVPQYSETHAYFNLQMVHAALSQLLVVGKAKEVQEMSYALFRETFCISPTAWTTHYSPKLWDSLKARAAFVPPDLKPLPDTIHLPHLKAEPKEDVEIRNESFRKAGLIPELPSLETLDFHQAVLLEEAKSIKFSLTPSEVTTHAHLLRYIHTHIDLASRTLPPDDIPSLAAQHLADLTASSPLPSAHLSFYIDLVLNNLKLHPNLDYHPPIPNIPFKPSYTDPKTKKFIRFHNCSCHYTLPLPYDIGPMACSYTAFIRCPHRPTNPPGTLCQCHICREIPTLPFQRYHTCLCHSNEELDHDVFAALCSEEWRKTEDYEKQRRGLIVREWSTKSGDTWEDWVRGREGLGMCWEGGWRMVRLGERVKGLVGGGKKSECEGMRGEGEDGKKFAGKGDDDEVTLAGGDETADKDFEEVGDEWEILSHDTLQ